jgi:hypothetical protein
MGFGALSGGLLLFAFMFLAGVIVLYVFYLLNLQNTLKEVGDSRRLVPAANVWLMFIPLFSVVYGFILYPKISDSVKAEYAHRGLPADGDFGRGIGLAMAIAGVVGIIPIDILKGIVGIASLVLFIIYWSKTAKYKAELMRSGKGEEDFIGASGDLLDN